MPTKDELVAFGQAHGVDVDSSMLKADIEAALTDAGYDPTTTGDTTVGTDEPTGGQPEADPTTAEEEVANTSSDAANSTYTEAPSTKETEEQPPPGPQVEQHRGQPEEASE